jgi:hypothetical protein
MIWDSLEKGRLVEGVGHSGVRLERLTKKGRNCVFGVVSGDNGPEFVCHPMSTGCFYKPTGEDQSGYLVPDRGSNRTPFFFYCLVLLTFRRRNFLLNFSTPCI